MRLPFLAHHLTFAIKVAGELDAEDRAINLSFNDQLGLECEV